MPEIFEHITSYVLLLAYLPLTLGLIFLNPIFILVLGLGRSHNVKRQTAGGENA